MSKIVSAIDETVRLFKSDFLEFFSHVHWFVPLILYVPLIVYFLWKIFSSTSLDLSKALALMGAGFLLWTFTEYTLHRFVFHFKPRKYFKRFFYTIHEIHHDYPSDSTRLVMPPPISIPLAIGFYFLFSFLLPGGLWEPFYVGFGIGYLAYDMTHYAVHHVNFRNDWWLFLKRYHLQHHFREADRAYGVSSPFWDMVFRSKPRRLESASPALVNFLGLLFVLLFSLFFLSLKIEMQGLNKFHVMFVGVVFFPYFLHPWSRKLLLIAFPMVLYGMMYDFFQYIPFSSLLPIRVSEPYLLDLNLFGIFSQGHVYPLHEFVYHFFQTPFWDIYCGVIYMLHVPMVIILLFVFWRFSSDELAARFIFAFWIMNIFAFLTYYFYPAAAPWFVQKYGFLQPLVPMPGDPAGLARFDQLLHLNLFTQNYQITPVPFGAVPSMHAGFAFLGFLYSLQFNRKLSFVLAFYCLSMWFAALYLQHHYLIDIILGILYALLAYVVVEKILQAPFLQGFHSLKKNLNDQGSFFLFHPKK